MIAEPGTNDQIRHVIYNVKAKKGMAGAIRDYDLLFMDNGILFACTAGALKSVLKASVGAQFGAVGAALAQGSMEKDRQNGRGGLQGLTAKQILEKNDKSFYLPYMDVQTVSLKKGLTGIGKMSFHLLEARYDCEFSKDQMDAARAAIGYKLSARMDGPDQMTLLRSR